MQDVDVFFRAQLLLGEGLHWDASRGVLLFVDIHGRRVFSSRFETGITSCWNTPQRVGWVIPDRNGSSILAGFQEGFATCILGEAGKLTWQWLNQLFPASSPLRLNDAKADSSGAVWAGSMNNENESVAEGSLFRLSPDGTVQLMDSGYCVTNGPAISQDERLMLHTDSLRREVYAFDLDVGSGRLTRKRLWKRFESRDGYPDGMCFDADGYVWVAHWGAGCVCRYDAAGALMTRISLPAPNVSNVCFAGDGLDRLIVSTARVGLEQAALDEFPLSGSLFEIDPGGVVGVPARRCEVIYPANGPSSTCNQADETSRN